MELADLYLTTGIILASLLIISELLAYSKCKANSVSELIFSFTLPCCCKVKEREVTV